MLSIYTAASMGMSKQAKSHMEPVTMKRLRQATGSSGLVGIYKYWHCGLHYITLVI